MSYNLVTSKALLSTNQQLMNKLTKAYGICFWDEVYISRSTPLNLYVFLFREFQPMTFASDDSSLILDQDINRFLV